MIVGGFIVNVNPDVVTTITNLMKEMLNRINKNEIEEKISKTKGCLFNEISFFLGLVFIKNIKFI